LDYYEPFLQRYPTMEDLAASSEPEVREAWDGLGYYARARNLHRTAQRVATELGGKLPDEPDAIRRLPGIGRYTAGAVLSFAYQKDAAILDTNAARVLTRVFGVRRRGSTTRSTTRQHRRLWQLAEAVTPPGKAARFNQAIMDLGATVCRARVPECVRCPLRRCCRTTLKNGE
jgi:A/G-specific adenine glycosylase